MHADEVEVDSALVRRLVASQLPEWAGLPIEPVLPLGTDNANFRLGDELLVRLPRHRPSVPALEKELRWLPELAPRLPVPVPRPVAVGEPADAYPFPWAVLSWIEGETATIGEIDEPLRTAEELAHCVSALRAVEASEAPPALRRGPLCALDGHVRGALATLAGRHDVDAVLHIWEEAVAAPAWEGPPTWCHSDLDLRNLVFAGGRLSGVLDWGGVGAGDPAADLAAAWKVLPDEARHGYAAALGADDASLARARGWLVFQGAMALSYYTVENNAPLFLEAERWLSEILGSAPRRSAARRA